MHERGGVPQLDIYRIFLPHVCPATLIFRFSSEYLELSDVKINNLFSHDASFKYKNVNSHVLKKLHIATPATRPETTVAFHCCM